MLQDKEGSICEVVLPQGLSTCSNQWQTLLQSEGKKVEASGLRIQQRVNFSKYVLHVDFLCGIIYFLCQIWTGFLYFFVRIFSVSGMFSLIQSLWTEDMAKKFVPRKGYSQDSEEVQYKTNTKLSA